MKIIILCGGSGSRLWPMSRQNKPKQFYPIISDRPLIEEVYKRFEFNFKKEDIYFSITKDLSLSLKKFFPNLDPAQIIIEPEKRDTAPAMGFAMVNLVGKYPDEPMVFVPADHYIANTKLFIKSLKVAEKIIVETGKMMDIAIRANFPSTTMGYTQIGEKFREVEDVDIYHFKSHREKPDIETAQKYLASGDYLWHANYYMWTPRLFLEAYEKYAPEMYAHLIKIKNFLGENNFNEVTEEYSQMEKISIDYAITEKMDPSEVLIIKGDFGWADIGAWDILYDKISDHEENVTQGEVIALDTKGSLIYGPKDKLITTLGLEDMIVVDTGDALLVCPKSRAQEVKKIIEKLEEEDNKYL